MKFQATLAPVHNRGTPSMDFLTELVVWGRCADEIIFAQNNVSDIYSKVKAELGPWESPLHRRAVMLEVMRVLAGFESSWNWNEGVDTSKSNKNTNENAETGAWQFSYGIRHIATEFDELFLFNGIQDGVTFQRVVKENHFLAMETEARLLRYTTKENGPLYKGIERKKTWPKRPELWVAEESIYPWLSRAAVSEFQKLLA